MTAIGDLLGVAAMVGIWMLGVTRIRSMIAGLGLQAVLLGALVIARGVQAGSATEEFTGVCAIAVKAMVLPAFLYWSSRQLEVGRDGGIGLTPGLSMLVGAGALVLCFFNGQLLSPTAELAASAGLSIGIVLSGLIMMLTRRSAFGMAIGFLTIDNGIYAYSATQASGVPLAVELGILFDVFVGVLLIGLVLFRVRRSFEHLDAFSMRELRE